MEQEVEQLKALVSDLFMKVESLENRVSFLEEEGAGKPKGPEPLLTCIQCFSEYKESENAEGHCKYHAGKLTYGGWKCTYSCCNATAGDRDKAKNIPGCTKGKHRSKHHTDYLYANYFFYMSDLSNNAQQLWLSMETEDHITDSVKWAEIGLSKDGKVFVIVGTSRIQPVAFAVFTSKELKKFKKSLAVVVDKSDPVGWSLKAEIHSSNSVANAITVSIKPASSKTPLTKRVSLVFDGNSPKPGEIETLSDPNPSKASVSYTVPDVVKEGPELEAGEDYSKDRKTDYSTEIDDDMFAIQLQQIGNTEVDSSWRQTNGKWNNLFSINVRVSNNSPNIISIDDVFGEYMNSDGEWVRCDNLWVGLKGSREFFDTKDFSIDCAAPMNLFVRLAISFEGDPPDSNDRCRAHPSLPQPLHLRVSFKDQEGRTASLRFEQGNRPLDIATAESRGKSWNRGKPLEFHLYADDINTRKRSDAALYYDENGVMCFMPAPCSNSSQYFYIRDFSTTAFKAKKANQKEFELTHMKKESNGSKVEIFAVVDLDNEITYALKTVITTPTSSAVGYYLLPSQDYSSTTLTTDPDEVIVNDEVEVSWNVPRASKNDRIEIYAPYAKKAVSGCYAYNRPAETEGSTKIKVPSVPGQYEARYYPAWLTGSYTGRRSDVYIAMGKFEVTAI